MAYKLGRVAAACCEHAFCRGVPRSSHNLPNEVHLSRSDHVSYSRDVIEFLPDVFIPDSVFLDLGHCDRQDTSDVAVEE